MLILYSYKKREEIVLIWSDIPGTLGNEMQGAEQCQLSV